jgi:hypothetical protein
MKVTDEENSKHRTENLLYAASEVSVKAVLEDFKDVAHAQFYENECDIRIFQATHSPFHPVWA